ncbi:hypothetical protein [Streptomyces pseudogriseolus]|uniref:hypothetical protein n=1 Tax=Streptomyces pseudogriseolus TaxID=36817 RepID=UPI003FA2C78A
MGVELTAFFSSGDGWAQPWVFDVALVEILRFGPPAGHTDLEVAMALTGLLHHDFVSYGTDGQGGHLGECAVGRVVALLDRPGGRPPA